MSKKTSLPWGMLGPPTVFRDGLGFTERRYVQAAAEQVGIYKLYDVATFGDGEWWIIPYMMDASDADPETGRPVKLAGPFENVDLAMLAAEMLMRSGSDIFEDDDYG